MGGGGGTLGCVGRNSVLDLPNHDFSHNCFSQHLHKPEMTFLGHVCETLQLCACLMFGVKGYNIIIIIHMSKNDSQIAILHAQLV